MIGEILILAGIIAFVFGYIYSPVVRMVSYAAFFVFVLGLFFKFFVKKYSEYERGIILRMGKFHRIAGPGWSIVIPFFERELTRVDVRTKMMDLFVPVAFTSDDLRLKIDGVVYYRIKDPTKAVLKIENYRTGLSNMLISETRNLIASMKMRDVFSKLDKINDLLADRIRHVAWQWGIDIPMVQVRSITPPEEIVLAMQQPEIAARSLQAQRFRAEARRAVIEAIGEAAKSLDDRAIMYLYLKALEEMSKGKATKIVFPMQFMSVMNEMGKGFSLGTGLGASGLNVSDAVEAIKKKLSES